MARRPVQFGHPFGWRMNRSGDRIDGTVRCNGDSLARVTGRNCGVRCIGRWLRRGGQHGAREWRDRRGDNQDEKPFRSSGQANDHLELPTNSALASPGMAIGWPSSAGWPTICATIGASWLQRAVARV